MYRLFIAIDLPEEIRLDLRPLCCGLPGAKWVPEEQVHLTLRFIGEVEGGLFRDIKEALADVAGPAFAIRLQGAGCFPPRKAPRVLWLGVEKNEELLRLRNRIENRLLRLGLEPEHRKFSPHITLARLTQTPLSRLTNYLAGNSLFVSPSFPVADFHLYSSRLSSKGAVHQLEASYPLTGNAAG